MGDANSVRSSSNTPIMTVGIWLTHDCTDSMTPSDSSNLGARLGPRLADIMSRAFVQTQVQMTPHKVKGGMALQDTFFRLVASEVNDTVGHLSRSLADDPDVTPWLKQTFNFLGRGTGQWAALLNFGVYGSGLASGISGLISNEMAPLVEKRFAANPNAVHSPSTLAQLVGSHIIPLQKGYDEAHKSALDQTRFKQLVDATETLPDYGSLIEMFRRGSITRSLFESVLRKGRVREEFITRIPSLAAVPLSTDELANMVDRGVMTPELAESRARQVGTDVDDFRKLTELVGVPPATELLLMARRRGIISEARLAKGIRQSPLRSEWIDVLTQLQFDPISTLQAADLVNQNLLPRARGRSIAEDNGTKSDDFDLLVEGAGRPPGIQDVLDLWNRGEVTESEVRQALLESTLKNKWVDLLMKTRRRIPPQDTVRMLINRGVLTPAQGVKRFMAVGFSADDAASLAELAQKDKTEEDRNLTKAEIISLYEFRLVNKSQAEGMLDDLGFDAQEQGFLLALADFRKSKRETDAAASVVRSKYVAHKITDSECSSLLDSLHIPADARDHLMQLWGLERDSNQHELTPAEVVNAHAAGLYDRAECHRRLEEQGYSSGDAEIKITLKVGTG